MSGIAITIPGSTSAGGLQYGFFFKLAYTASFPNPIMLVQLGLPCGGYFYTAVNTGGGITTGVQATGNGGNWSGTQGGSPAISVNTWYYLTYALGYVSPNVVHHMYIYQNGLGWYDGTVTSLGTAVATDTVQPAVLGLGTVVNAANIFSGYQHFTNMPGFEISKFWLRNANPSGATAYGGPTGGTRLAVPVSDGDITALSPLIFYTCRQTVGTLSTLTDATSNHYDATAGPLGLQAMSDGPYA